jgi:hypothetical protein
VHTPSQSYDVQIVSNVTPIYDILSRILWVSLAGIPFILIVTRAGGYWLSRRAMQSVLHITQTTKSIGERSLAERLTLPPAQDELRELSESLNDILPRLETAFRRIGTRLASTICFRLVRKRGYSQEPVTAQV